MTVTLAELRAIDLFEGVPDEQLLPWLDALEERTLALGEGEELRLFTLLLEGRLDGYMIADPAAGRDHTHVAPTWLGAIIALTEMEPLIEVRAPEPCRIATVEPERFKALLFATPDAFKRVMRTFRPVLSRFSAIESQREKLAALGQMSAGLAHELNNPAAAARRSAAALGEALDVLNGVMAKFVESGVERDDAAELLRLQRAAVACAAAAPARDTLAAADAEDAMAALLERHGVAEPWQLAEPLAGAGVDEAWVADVARYAGPALPAALRWVATTLTARTLVDDLRDASERMSELVGAIKAYTYMDQASLQEVDVHDGIESTLAILSHKLRPTSIEVRREYGADVPRICVYGSELNMVWTNVLDNAIDALGERGTITIATAPWEDTGVEVTIADDGPGIPAELQHRIWEPFFTTKPVGAGTGLGLDTAHRIVCDRHDGSIELDSRPGLTAFKVRLPRTPAKA